MSEVTAKRPTWAEIDLDNLIHNFRLMKSAAGSDVSIMAAVKADAYGHGAADCARALDVAGCQWFGVALPEEGVELRDAGIDWPILCLGGFWEGEEGFMIARRLTPALFRLDLLECFDRASREAGVTSDYHLKVDTGMGRLGVQAAELGVFLDEATKFQSLRLDGVMTHFASADDPDQEEVTGQQMSTFDHAVEMVRARGFTPRWVHEANSAAAHAGARTRGNLVRLGGVLYGLWRDVTNPAIPPLDWRPVMSLHSRVTYLKTVPGGSRLGYGGTFMTRRESRIATLPIGYGDGLRRALSNRGHVLVRGKPAPIVGRISMDLALVDVTDIPGVVAGDDVVIIGRDGDSQVTAEEIASLAGTISYEVTCGISDRVPRIAVAGR
ncbi:MAG TPA: alanine racemase [Blastocatellia bacterium]|nr:alanine racemase [Blastocatellia bacterium]